MRWLTNLTLCATLSSCGTLDGTIDRGGIVLEDLVTHTTQELGKLKTEALREIKEQMSDLKTETLREVKETIEEVTPQVIEDVMNSESVAFLIVSVTFLLGLVVVVALLLLLGAARTAYRRWQHPKDCSLR